MKCSVSRCRGGATHAIHTPTGKHRDLKEDEILLPPEFAPVCAYHLALFIRWESQRPAVER